MGCPEIDVVSKMFPSSFFKYWMIDKVQKPSNSQVGCSPLFVVVTEPSQLGGGGGTAVLGLLFYYSESWLKLNPLVLGLKVAQCTSSRQEVRKMEELVEGELKREAEVL
jgi:hypothetical protein